MRSVRADSSDSVGGGDSPPEYRVRIWTPPPAAHSGWFVDEWDVTDAEQVTDVIEWGAEEADGNPFEVFLRWEDHHFTRDGRPEPYSRYALIYGRPADEAATIEIIYSESQ